MGFMYLQGKDVPKDEIEAYLWLSLAALSPDSADYVKEAHSRLRDGARKEAETIEAKMSPEVLVKSRHRLLLVSREIEERRKTAAR